MAIAAMQTMLLLDLIGRPRLDAPLRAVLCTASAANTGIRDLIPPHCGLPLADGITFSENRVDSEMEILNFRVCYLKYNTGCVSGIARVHVGQVGLFSKDRIDPFLLSGFICGLRPG